MGSSFAYAYQDDCASTVPLDALRGQAMRRLAGVEHSLQSKGVGAAFSRAAKADPVGDMGMIGGLIMGMLLGSGLSQLLPAKFSVGAAFHYETFSTALDGISILRDQEAEERRARKLDDYPEGRRKCAFAVAGKMGKKFNMVSANQNQRLSFDALSDLACMHEILDMLDRLEREGVRVLQVGRQEPVYALLKQITRKMAADGVVRHCPDHVLMAS